MTKILKKSKKIFLTIGISLILIVCLFLANLFAGLIVPANTSGSEVSSQAYELHFLTLAKSQVKEESVALAPDFRKIGAGGFIWEKDERFWLVSSAYASKNDAVLVQSSIKQTQNLESEIISVKFEAITISGEFSAEEKKAVSKALSAGINFYLSIYDIAISLDTGVYNEISAKLAVNNAHNTLAGVYADFTTIYPSPLAKPFLSIENMLKSMAKVSQNLCTGQKLSNEQTYSSLLKYRYMEVLKIYYDFLQEF